MLFLMGPSSVGGLTLLMLFALFFELVNAGCEHCMGGVSGCTDPTTCPWNTALLKNAKAVATTLGGTAITLISLNALLPPDLLAAFPRSALDALLLLAGMPAKGTPVDLNDVNLTVRTLKDWYLAGRVSRVEVSRGMDLISERIAASGDEMKFKTMQLQMRSLELAMKDDQPSQLEWSGYRHYIIARLSHYVLFNDPSSWVKGVQDKATAASSSASSLVAQVLFPVQSAADVVIPQILHYFILFMYAMGFEHPITLSLFVGKTVYHYVKTQNVSWLGAFEIFLVYIKALDEDPSLKMSTIWNGGSQDTHLNDARSAFVRRWGSSAVFFRTRGGTPQPGLANATNDPSGNGAGNGKPIIVWNKKWNKDPKAAPCLTFNLGHPTHPQASLLPDGSCKYAHVCDHFVTDKGPNGRCRSTKHKRNKCDNPAKGAKQE